MGLVLIVIDMPDYSFGLTAQNIVMFVDNGSWATARGATSSGDIYKDNTGTRTEGSLIGFYRIARFGMPFDTAAIPDALDLAGATVKIKVYIESVATADAGHYLRLVDFNPANPASTVGADYNDFGTTAFANDILATDFSGAGYYTFTLNASGIANINKTGISCFGLRQRNDVENSTPTGSNEINVQTRTEANPPILEIYLPAGGQNPMFFGGGRGFTLG